MYGETYDTSSYMILFSNMHFIVMFVTADSDYTITRHWMWNSLLRNSQSVIRRQRVLTYTYYNIQYARKSNLKGLKN